MTMLVGVCRAAGQANGANVPRFAETQAGRVVRVEWAKGIQMRKAATFKVFAARLVLFGTCLAVLASPRLGHAQVAHGERVQHEVFDDDLLNADLGTPFGGYVPAGHLPPARTQLIRPRTNFLPELYKSIEHQ